MSVDNQLTVRRTFDAPRERVWRAFVDPDEFAQWFVPEEMEAEVRAFDPVPGGEMSVTWTADEHQMDNEGTFEEVVEHERIVTVEEIEGGELRLTCEFLDVDDGMEVVVTQEFPGPVPDGADEGWAAILDNLEEVLETMTESRTGETRLTVEPDRHAITVSRDFDAPPERVFEAHVDPTAIPEWWGPRRYETVVDEMDTRPGGRWRFLNRDPDGNEHAFHGVYHDVVAPERVVQTFEYEGTPGHVSLETATFEDVDEQTRLTVTTVFQCVEDRDAMVESGMEDGLRETWERLAELVESAGTTSEEGEVDA